LVFNLKRRIKMNGNKLWDFLMTPMSYDISFTWGKTEPFQNTGTVYTWMVVAVVSMTTGMGAAVMKWGGGSIEGVLKAVSVLVKSVGM